jgi:hypothetical protein
VALDVYAHADVGAEGLRRRQAMNFDTLLGLSSMNPLSTFGESVMTAV